MIPQEILIEDKDITLLSSTLLFKWKRDMVTVRAIDIIRLAVTENNMDVISEVVASTEFNNKVAGIAARDGNDEILSYIVRKGVNYYYQIIFNAERGGHKEILRDKDGNIVGVTNYDNIDYIC